MQRSRINSFIDCYFQQCKNIFIVSIFFAALLFNLSINAQHKNLTFKHLTIEDGLSQNAVFAILQDSKGFMWFGTKDGLNKYNGYTFTVYTHDPYDTTTISSNFIKIIFEDSRGTLWIVTFNGELNLMDSKTEKFYRISIDTNNPKSLSSDDITSIAEDRDGNIWLGTIGGGLNMIERENILKSNYEFIHFEHNPDDTNSLNDNNVNSLLIDNSGILWIGTDSGLSKMISNAKKQFQRFVIDTKNKTVPPNIIDKNIRAILNDSDSTLWLGSSSGVILFNKNNGRFVHYPNRYDIKKYGWGVANDIIKDRSGNLWIGTPAGLMRFDTASKTYIYFEPNSLDYNSISYGGISKIVSDRSGNIWIGTNGYGINIYYPEANRFHSFPYKKFSDKIKTNISIRTIFEDSQNIIWFSSEVLYEWNRKTNELTSHADQQDWNQMGSTGAWSIIEDKNGYLWFGTYRGLYRFNRKTNEHLQFKFNPDNPEALQDEIVLGVFEDNYGSIWAVTEKHLSKLIDVQNGRFINYIYIDKRIANFMMSSSMYQDKQDNLWFTTNIGLFKFNPEKEKFTSYRNNPQDHNSINNNLIRSIYPDPIAPDKILWIGTAGGGINKFDLQNETFTHITEKDGLPNNVVYGILPDEEGNLWLSTNKGLSKYNPAKNHFTNYDVNDGLQSNEFNTGAFFKSKSGELFFGGINGFNYFFPGEVGNKKSIPNLVFTDFKLFNKPVSVKQDNSILKEVISETKEIKLSHSDNVISFEFASLDYYAPTKNQYAYKLEGFNEGWIQLGTKREVSFTNLDPGEYVLRVKGTNSDGVWNEKGASIRIIITPPVWQTWWAYLLYGFVLLTGLYLIRRYELNRVNLKNQLKFEKVESKTLREIDQMKSRFFTNISHEFRTPLTLILGQIDSLQSSIKDLKDKGKLQIAHKNAKRVLRLINQLLDLSKLEAGSLELKAEPHNIVSFLKNLFYSFDLLADKKNIKLSFTSKQEKVFVNVEPDKMEKVFYNLVSNAFKFTAEGGEIAINVFEVDEIPVLVRKYDSENQKSNLNRRKLFQTDKAIDSTIRNKYAAISIKDTGIGIPEDRLSNIFDRYYQADNLQTQDYEGTGIGLALAKELVELHNGIISVNSKVDEGTEFVIYLPFSKERKLTRDQIALVDQTQKISKEFQNQLEDEVLNMTDEHQDHPINGDKINRQIILVVEDNPDVRAYISEQLESKYSVIQAVNGEDGIVEAQEAIPDLIITDVMMPKMDGIEFCKELRKNEKTSHIPIIMLTAKASLDEKIEGLETGVEAYLTKPFSTKELTVRVSNLIHQREQLRKRFSGKTIIKPSDVTSTSIDQTFLEKVIKSVEAHIEDEQFNVDKLAEEVYMSISQLNRKLRALIDQPAGQLIRSMRLNRAAGLLKQNVGSVAEICYMVGFNDQSYFTRTFKKQFGFTPSEFKKQ